MSYEAYSALSVLQGLLGNLGVGLQEIILIVFILGSLIFFASNFKIGLIMLFLFSGINFILFESTGYDATISLYAVLISLVLMAFSIYTTKNTTTGGIY